MTQSSQQLGQTAKQIRRSTAKLLYQAQSGHPGSSFSIIDILTALYFANILKYNPKNPQWTGRDYFLLSNGHAAPGFYATLSHAGYYPLKKLKGLRQINTPLHGHPKRNTFPGVEMSSGSLGQGLSVGIGIALGLKMKNKKNQVYVMMSDGEQQEGSTWEALMFAPKHKLDNLIAIVDKNDNQINGPTAEIMPAMDPLAEKYKAFHWQTIEIDGHNFTQILKAFNQAQKAKGPFMIISHTVTGKGISFMEGDYHWHHGVLTDELYQQALKDLQ